MFLVNVTDTKLSIFSVENYGIVFCVMKLEKELMLLKLLEKHTGKQNFLFLLKGNSAHNLLENMACISI